MKTWKFCGQSVMPDLFIVETDVFTPFSAFAQSGSLFLISITKHLAP